MGHRLSKIYTKTGDDGTTGLSNGARVSKDDARIVAIGSVDELNSAVGMVLSCELKQDCKDMLTTVQHLLFNVGGELSLPGHSLIEEPHIETLENQIDNLNSGLEPLKDFILPGGSTAAANCHLARAICRRVERDLVALNRKEDVPIAIMKYINRLSDFLFVMARHINKLDSHPDVLWKIQKD